MVFLVKRHDVLKHIAAYQKWGQKEKASAAERKHARKVLRLLFQELKDRKKVEKIIDEKFKFRLDFSI